ncbi:MAG: tRNA1(Val) (adenine(37)-N6)-methyltransferase [Eubacterium sp.]|nr:tRNA1(Val) (adenine(37)-N6)-methyltransferase [Eubacterium sp.]
MTDILREGERLDDLQRDGLMLIQRPDWFCFGIDAVLLSAFAEVRENDECIDLCTGNGVIPILMQARTEGKFFKGLEIQEDVADLAKRSVAYNHLEDRVDITCGDVKNAVQIYGARCADVITCNPPYLSEEGGLINPTDQKAIARHEVYCSLEDVIETASKLIRPGKRFYLVHRPFRLAEIIEKMHKYRLEPKRMRLVCPNANSEPNLVYICGIYDGKPGMTVERPLIVYDEKGEYTEEVRVMYEG